jgi:hypothetical protein
MMAKTRPPVALQRLMYCSVSRPPLTQGKLSAIFEASKQRNLRDDITGMLLADGRLNIHFIEGPEPAVQALWARIRADTRHHCLVLLLQELGASERLFAEHAMLRGQASRAEMLALVRTAYLQTEGAHRPVWAHAMAPLMILLDGEFSHAYAGAARHAVQSSL